jgi:5'-deoxynucleotidase YfbR-like HD superfamily hydrolase
MMIAGGNVRRFHSNQVIKDRTVGHHTFNMMVLADCLYDGATPQRLIKAILYHDLHEGIIGDVPYPTKRVTPSMRAEFDKLEASINAEYRLEVELTKEEHSVLTALDMLEFYMYLVQERKLGNQNNEEEFQLAIGSLVDLRQEIPCHLRSTWDNIYATINEQI